MEIMEINYKENIFHPDYLMENLDNPIPLIYKEGERFYPINTSLEELAHKKRFISLISYDLTEALSFFMSGRGIKNLTLIQLLRLLKLKKENRISYPTSDLAKYERYLPLLEFDEKIITLIESGRLFPEIALLLNSLPKKELFVNILDNFHLTFSEQREVITFLKDSQENLDLSKFKKKEELLLAIRKILSPELTSTQEKFNSLKKKLSLSKNIKLKESPYFETKELKLEISFKSFEELIKRLKELDKNIGEKEEIWKEILKLI